MQKLVQLITKYQSGIEQVAAVIITLCAVVFISILLVKAMKDFSGGSLGEAVKKVGYALGVALMAYMSFKGITILLESIAPDTEIIPKGLAINQQILDKVPFTKL